MKKIPTKVSAQLRAAACLLSHPNLPYQTIGGINRQEFSCHAIAKALDLHTNFWMDQYKKWPPCLQYLKWLGMQMDGGGFGFDKPFGPFGSTWRSGDAAAQETRYAWLMFAADLWDEGLRPDNL